MNVLLVGNYVIDRQQSMQLFCDMLARGLSELGHTIRIARPEPVAGRIVRRSTGVGKWLGYLDKFLVFPQRLAREASWADVVHICDHSNAFYASVLKRIPNIVTCHDLLAVRGALGEDTDCPASRSGKVLQKWILNGLRQAGMVACVSSFTQRDLDRLAGPAVKSQVVMNGLNQPYRRLSRDEASSRLKSIVGLETRPFVLNVGSSLRRKNRDGVLRIFQKASASWDANLVFAGAPLTPDLVELGDRLKISNRIIQVVDPDHQVLEALYNRAHAFVFPSRFEGFGWPVIEAQACGCPVLCSDRCSLPEIAGGSALVRAAEDEEGFAQDILALLDPSLRDAWSSRGFLNSQRFSTSNMLKQYVSLYERLIGQK
jgi:glycosyltransferase involved in cell wall biosynthesis